MKIQETGVNSFMVKLTMGLLCTALLIGLVYFARAVVIPMIMAALLGVLLRPVERLFAVRLKIPRIISIILTLLIFLLVVGGVVTLITYELVQFKEDLPKLLQNLEARFRDIRFWTDENLHIPYDNQEKYIESATAQTVSHSTEMLQRTISSISVIFTNVLVMPVLLFLVMYYRPLILEFLLSVFGEKNRQTMSVIIADTKVMLQGYISGLCLEMFSVAILQTIAMYLAGAKYPLLIGLIAAILNIIPYLGIPIAAIIALIISLVTDNDLREMLFIVIGFVSVQFIDNNILLPNFVGSRARINALASILGVLTGGIICGVPGMFLSIPLLAMMKIVFDHIDHLKPWGKLLGEEHETYKRESRFVKRRKQ